MRSKEGSILFENLAEYEVDLLYKQLDLPVLVANFGIGEITD